jgi:hypothetical protein
MAPFKIQIFFTLLYCTLLYFALLYFDHLGLSRAIQHVRTVTYYIKVDWFKRSSQFLANTNTTEPHLAGSWFSGPSTQSRIGLALLGKLVENCTKLALKLPVFRPSTVQCYGLQNFKSGAVGRFRRRYVL